MGSVRGNLIPFYEQIIVPWLIIQLPGKTAADVPSVWALATHVGDFDVAPGFGLAWPTLAVGAIWSEVADARSLSFLLFL